MARADSGPAGWQKSFPAEQVGNQLSGTDLRMIVVASGQEDASGAVAALRSALKQSKKAGLVMDQSAIGNVGTLDDKGIVKAAQNLPVERVVIVRVFAGGAGSEASAVVTIYDKAGKTLSAFTTEKGVPLTAAVARNDGMGVSSEAAGAVAEVMHTKAEKTDAQREWENNVIWFEDWSGINQYGVVVARWSVPRRGIRREPLDGAQFYEAVGRHDLATSYSRKKTIRSAVGGTGGIMMLVGLGTMSWGLYESLKYSSSNYMSIGGVSFEYAKVGTDTTTPWVLTGIFLGGGMITGIVAAFINPNPVRPDEARQMAIDYDRKLRERLGLPELQGTGGISQNETKPATPRGISNFAISPWIAPTGAGAVSGFNF